MPHSPATPSPQLYFETINAFQRSGALKAAIELELFSAIGATPSTATEVAQRCRCPLRGIRILCDTLVVMGFLTKNGDRYSLTPDSAFFLDRKSPAYVGDSAKFFFAQGITEAYDDLATTIRQGRVHTSELGTTAPEHPAWIEFARAMGPMMVPAANTAAALVRIDQTRDSRILDIATSHGVYGIAFARANPRAHFVALDWEPVLAVTRENAKAAGIGDRFSTIAGDAFTVDLGCDYDLVLVPNFLHHFNAADCTRFLKRVYHSLRPGGCVVIIEFVPNEDRVTPPGPASFALVMLGTTPEGDAYTFAEYRAMLASAGFGTAALHELPPTTARAVIATK